MTVIAAGVGHEDAEQRHLHSWRRAKIPDAEWPKCSHFAGMSKPRRKALAVIRGECHQNIDLLLQVVTSHGCRSDEDVFIMPEEIPKVNGTCGLQLLSCQHGGIGIY
jgi:hypothetical protein